MPDKVHAAVARIKRHTKLPVAVGFGVRTAEAGARHCRKAPTAWWSARRWSTRCKDSLDKNGKATARTVKAVTELVAELAEGVRGAKRQSRNSHTVIAGLDPAIHLSV